MRRCYYVAYTLIIDLIYIVYVYAARTYVESHILNAACIHDGSESRCHLHASHRIVRIAHININVTYLDPPSVQDQVHLPLLYGSAGNGPRSSWLRRWPWLSTSLLLLITTQASLLTRIAPRRAILGRRARAQSSRTLAGGRGHQPATPRAVGWGLALATSGSSGPSAWSSTTWRGRRGGATPPGRRCHFD